MSVLIIYTHPNTKEHCHTILEEVKDNLKSRDIPFDTIDLYKIKYDPVLHKEEHYTAGNRKVSKQNKKFQDMISKADKLIFIYPNWWNSPPAILKGFYERVLTSRFAFKYEGKTPKGLLKGKKAAVFVTSGAPLVFYKTMEKSIASKITTKYTLKFCGIKSKSFDIGNANKLTEKQIQKIKKTVKKGLDYLLP